MHDDRTERPGAATLFARAGRTTLYHVDLNGLFNAGLRASQPTPLPADPPDWPEQLERWIAN